MKQIMLFSLTVLSTASLFGMSNHKVLLQDGKKIDLLLVQSAITTLESLVKQANNGNQNAQKALIALLKVRSLEPEEFDTLSHEDCPQFVYEGKLQRNIGLVAKNGLRCESDMFSLADPIKHDE